MRVCITGGMGFIGSHIVVDLLNNGDEVTVLARNPAKIPAFLDTPGVSVVEGGLDDGGAIREVLTGKDACVHNALHWEEEPTELQLKDTRTAIRVFEAAAHSGVPHLIYTSSTAVMRPFKSLMDETVRLAPMDFYGATKAAGEAFLSAFSHRTEMRCNVIRPGPTIGGPAVDRGPVKSDRRFGEIVSAAKEDRDIVVSKGDGRQFISARDLAQVYSAVLHSQANRQVYVAVAQNFTTWEEVARQTVEMAASASKITVESKGSNQEVGLFDVSKIEREFGLRFDSRTAMRAHLEHLLAEP